MEKGYEKIDFLYSSFTEEGFLQELENFMKSSKDLNYFTYKLSVFFNIQLLNKTIDYYISKKWKLDYLVQNLAHLFDDNLFQKSIKYHKKIKADFDYFARFLPNYITNDIFAKIIEIHKQDEKSYGYLALYQTKKYFSHELLAESIKYNKEISAETYLFEKLLDEKFPNADKRRTRKQVEQEWNRSIDMFLHYD
jgi:hypothetical protein